jgi:DNA-binding NarL/FixJ family response regulator
MKVFIADDSAMFRERLKELLSEVTGIEIIDEAGDGTEAIRGIQELKPDLVILDIRMPGGNGIDTLKNIKKMKQAPVVIMITNYPYPQYRKKCMELGADYFFKKSTEFEKVIEVIEQLAQNKP